MSDLVNNQLPRINDKKKHAQLLEKGFNCNNQVIGLNNMDVLSLFKWIQMNIISPLKMSPEMYYKMLDELHPT